MLYCKKSISGLSCPDGKVRKMDGKNRLNGIYTPTILQNAIGTPLRSEQRTGELLPRVLSRLDMLTIFIAVVVFIPSVSIVQAARGAGIVIYLGWILSAATFLLPG